MNAVGFHTCPDTGAFRFDKASRMESNTVSGDNGLAIKPYTGKEAYEIALGINDEYEGAIGCAMTFPACKDKMSNIKEAIEKFNEHAVFVAGNNPPDFTTVKKIRKTIVETLQSHEKQTELIAELVGVIIQALDDGGYVADYGDDDEPILYQKKEDGGAYCHAVALSMMELIKKAKGEDSSY